MNKKETHVEHMFNTNNAETRPNETCSDIKHMFSC